ncbi:GntR family transcriptional regulator [Enterococcus sp.]|uniref:GntR family transcriptional regulator n=1 Tax=Enterococcus sp. TaxID=35783 RepID=UPI00289E0448|nr:GntR family transcriptional regulator [Enterococcus sp.]
MSKFDFIVEDLLSKIYQKKTSNQLKLPSERELSKKYEVSRNTIRKALKKLIDIGVIESIPQKGYHIKLKKNRESLIYSSVTEKKSNQIQSKVLFLAQREMSRKEQNIFDEKLIGKVWELKRLRILDAKVMEIQESIFPKKIFPYFDEDMGKGSIQKLILESGYLISHSLTSFEAINLSDQEAEIFHVRKNFAAMKVVSRTITTEGSVIELTSRIAIDYKGTFRLPFNKSTYDFRHQQDKLNDF